ncbi:hypothetical protein [Sphingomonas endolithica]|uniref:hypothetical protein n=1 Tax=Sphingomonas endolithica TaxID=2972485 RepID=UPI0021B05AAD|nr:hypothetical protein [Sphingomonas sp. ZFBP2030]
MNARSTTIAIACVLLAGCGGPGPTGNSAAADVAPDPVEAQIANLSAPLQRTTFFRAIQDADYACQTIVQVVPRGKIEGKPVWAVECDGGAQYVIELQRGGVFHVSGVPKPTR